MRKSLLALLIRKNSEQILFKTIFFTRINTMENFLEIPVDVDIVVLFASYFAILKEILCIERIVCTILRGPFFLVKNKLTNKSHNFKMQTLE